MPVPRSFKPKNPFGPPVAQTPPEQPEQTQVQTPTVQTPTVEAPTVQTPTVQTPVVQTPTAQTPVVQEPAVTTPEQEEETPTIELPTVGNTYTGKPRNVNDIYNSVSDGGTNPLGIRSMYAAARKQELNDYYHNTLHPAYLAYQEALEGYKAGKVSKAEYQKAKQEYSFLYYSSRALYDTYDTLKDRDNLRDMRGASSADIEASLKKWNDAYEEATASLADADTNLAELTAKHATKSEELSAAWESFGTDYDAFSKEYDALIKKIQAFNKSRNRTKAKADKLNKQLADLNARYDDLLSRQEALNKQNDELTDLENDYAKAIGKYNANAWLVGDMGYVLGTGADMWKDQYYREHPTELYMTQLVDYDKESNKAVGTKITYEDLFSQIEDMYDQRAGLEGNALDDLNVKIATYNSVMNSGLAFAKLDADGLTAAKQYFANQAAPIERELAELSYLDEYDWSVANGMSFNIPEGHDPTVDRQRRDELQSKYNRIKSWETKVATRKYETVYDPKIAALQPETQDLINKYILSVADPDGSDLGDPEILNEQYTNTVTEAGFINSLRAKRAIKQALSAEGIAEDEAERLLKYIDYEANAARVTNMTTSDKETGRTSLAEDAANAGLVSNFMAQLLLGLGSGMGAVENIAQYLGSIHADTERKGDEVEVRFSRIDPNLGEAAPIDFNSFGNLGTIASQEIDRGELMRMQEFAAKLTEDKEWQDRLAGLMHGAYSLGESMAQSAIIGMMAGAGWESSMLLLSGSAASSTMQEMHQQGYSDTAVIAGGIISGFAEYITEKVSIENLLSVYNRGELTGLTKSELAKRIGVNLLSQTVAEASEEGASDLINLAYDQYIGKLLNGGLTQLEMQATQMQQENPGMSWEDALYAAHADWVKELGQDILSGALSGLFMGAGGFAMGYAQGRSGAKNTGRTLLQQGNDAAMYEAVEKLKGSVAAQAAGLNSEVRAASPLQLGRMYGSWMNAKTMQAIEGRLTELGVTDITPELLRGINAGAAGDYLLSNERLAVENCKEATQVMQELKDLNDAMQAAAKNDTNVKTDGLEQWALDMQAEQGQTNFAYLETQIPQLQLNNKTMSAAEAQYNATKESNPGSTVLNQVQSDLESAGMQAQDAVRQGELLTKIFSGELLTGKEMRALDLNSPAVNKVFVERSGLTGVPKTGITYKMKQTYVNQVTRQNMVVKQTQEDMKAGVKELGKQITRRSAERTRAMQQEINNAQKNPIQKFFTQGKTKAAARVEAARQAAEEKAATQFKPGTSDHEVARQVEKLTGVSVLPRSLYLAMARQQLGVETLSTQQQAAADQEYTNYIYGLGLSDSLTRALINAPAATSATEAVAGQVVFDKSVDQAKLLEEMTNPEKESIRGASVKVLQEIAREFGLKIVLYETRNINGTWAAVAPDGAITTDNGWYDPKDKSIHLDINAGDNGQGVMLFTAAHELTHLIKDVSPAQYEALKTFLFEKLNLQGENTVNDLVKAQIRKAKAQGRTLSIAKAEEEVVADACSVMLARGDVMQSMSQLKTEHKGLWQRIVDKIREIFEKVSNLYSKMDPDTAEGKMVADMVDSFSELQQLWMGGLSEASTKLSEMAPKDIDGNPGPIQYSTRSMVQGSGLTYRESDGAVLDRNGDEVKNVTPEMMHDTPLGKLVQDAVQIGNISEKDAKVQYKFLSELMNQIIEKRDAALIWEIAGTQMFSAIRSNSDTQYGKTIDFSTICKKTQQMVDVMSGAMMELGHGLNRQQVEMAYRKTIEAGEPVPCPVCYVFSRWIGIGGILDDMHVFQQQYAGMSETELRGFMTGIEQQARDFVEDKIKNAKDKDAARKKYYDKNGVLKLGFAMSEMKSPLNTKIQNARNKINKSLDNSLQIQALEAEAEEAKKLGVPFKFTSQNAESIKALRKAVLSEAQLEKLEADIAKYEEQLRPIEAYQYLNGTIALRGDNGEWVKNPNFKPVPNDVLFNLNAGSEFATNYPYSWKYRTTRGCAAGKAMLPYSDARVGETIQGIRYNNVNDIYTNAEDNPFLNGEEADRKKDLEAARAKQRRQNLIGGQRYQSTSDFRFEYGSDYLITFMEMQAIGANVQLYTKVIEAVDFLATMGADINMSVMPLGNGFIENEDGTRTLVFSPVTGINGDAAIEMAKKYDNAQLILVGISDDHIRTAIAGTDVTFVIPFHGSGNSTANIQTLMDMLDEALDVTSARDYTSVQTDHVRTDGTKEQKAHWQAMRDLRLAIITGNAANLTAQQQALLNENQYLADLWQRFYVEGVDEKTYQCFLAKAQAEQIFPYEYWDKNSTYDNADVNGDRFQEYCALMGIVPRFSGINAKGENVGFGDFTKDKGYWKLLIDRSMYTNVYDDQGNWIGYGKYRDQSPINCTNFNVETLDPSWAKATYGNVMTAENDPTKTSAIVKAVVDEVVREVQSGERVDVMHSGRGAAGVQWAFAEGALTDRQQPAFYAHLAEVKKLGYSSLTTRDGLDIFVPRGDGRGTIIISNGDYDNPVIERVYNMDSTKFDSYEIMQMVREWIVDAETRSTGGREARQSVETIENQYGEGSVAYTTRWDDQAHAWKDQLRKGTPRRAANRAALNDEIKHSGRDFSGVTQGLNFRDPTGELLDRVFDGTKKYETRRYTVSRGNGKLAGAFLNKPMGIVHTGAGPAQLEGFWELGDGQLRNYDWLKEHAAELGNDGTEFEAKPGEKRWVYPIKWAERVDPEPVATVGQVVRDISDITSQYAGEDDTDAETVIEELEDHVFSDPEIGERVMHSIRENQKDWNPLRDKDGNVVLVYKAFYAYDGGLYPPMISNMSDQEKKKVTNAVSGTLSGLDTPGGVVLDAEVGQLARYKADATEYDVQFRKLWKGSSKAIKRIKAELKAEGFNTKSGLNAEARAAAEAKMEQEFPKLKAASKERIVERAGELVRNESGRLAVVNSKGGGTLAFRPGWHLGQWPNLRQFDVDDPVTGKERSAMPDSLVFCACEIAGDIDYQLEAMELGMTANGGFDRTQAGLPYVPVDGYYKYRTNADPTTEPWYITGAIKVVEVLDDEDCRRICAQYGVTPQPRVSHKDIDLAAYGLKRGPIKAPSMEKLQAYKKSQAAIQNEAALAEALADPAFQDAYASRPINFNDKEIQAEFARNYQDAEYYRNLYEQRHSARNTSSVEQAAELLDKQMGKGTAKNLEALVRKYEQRAENAQKQAKFERAQAKLQQQQFKKELANAKRVQGKLQRAQGRLLRITNNEINKAKRENQRRETALKKKMADLATDKAWEVGLAKSQGANKLAQQKRDYESKLRMKDRDITNTRQWARGLARSREQNARAEEKRLAKEKMGLQKLVLSLPGSAAIAERRKFNIKAKKVEMINGGANVCTPIHFNNEADTTLPEKAAAFRQKVSDLYGSYYRKMHNDVAELDKAAKLQTRTDNLSTMINVCRASAATPEVFYNTAMVDKAGNVIGPAFKDLLLCYDENGKFDPKMQAALQDYMYHKHNVDRMSLESRAIQRVQDFVNNGRQWLLDMTNTELAQLAADGNETVREYVQLMHWANNVKNKAVLPDADNYAVNAQASQELCDLYEREMPWLKDKAEEIYKYWDLFMREWAVGTSISEADYEDMREMYPHYVPTYRVQEGQKARITRTQNGIVTGEMTKAAKGSTKELLSLEDQFVKSMQNIVRGARLNDVTRNLVEELLFDDEGVFSDFGVYDWESASSAMRQTFWDFDDQENEQRIEKLTMDGKEVYRISCWVDGEKMSAYVNRAMFEGMQALSGYQSDLARGLTKIGNTITKPMKAMITGYNPFFAAKNIIRDQHTALTNSQLGIAYEIYMGKAAAKIASNSDEWATFRALGGVSNTQTRIEGGFARAMQPESGVKKAAGWALEKIGAMGEYSEAVSRFAEYLGVIDMLGGDTYENRMAAIRAAAEVTVDFGRGGSWGRVINAWVPYWNANMQGLDKMIRNIAEQPDVKSMIARTGRAIMVNIIPAALQAALIYALGRWKDYEELSDQQKDNYYCFPVIGKEHKFVKIPKSQDWAAFISTPFLRIMEGVNGRDDPWEGWFESAVMPNMPFDTRTVLGVENVPVLLPLPAEWALELAENKNYAGGAIIPYNLLDASAKEQFDADTSVLAYYFGQIFKGSPMALDYIIDDYMGNFWGVLAKSLPVSPLASRGIFTGEASVGEKLADMKITILSPFITDSRVSNSTMAAYYDMINTLEQEVTDAGAHGDKKDAEHYKIYEALSQTGGYIDQIRAITSKAREHVKGEEQNQIRWEAVGLADMAMEFVEKCLAGEIEDPELWMTYAPYGDTILGEAEALKKYEDDFNYDGQLGKPKVFYDRTGDVDIKYDLEANPEWQREYVALRTDAYRNTLNTVIKSADYQNDTDAGKAARLEAAKRIALKNAETEMIQFLAGQKAEGETVGKTDYSAEQRAAAYSVSWLMGESDAYKPEITDQFVDLYDYHEQYSFIPTDATKKTFKDQSDASKVYVLDSQQQAKYAQVYHDEITDAYTKVMAAPEFKSASPELRAAMLAKAKTYANDAIKEKFDAWLKQTGATATTQEKASPDISLEAKYAVQRALGDDHAMQREVTDELIRLYQYSDVGEVEFFPIVTAPKSYVDDTNKDYIWNLSDEQREVYMGMMFDTYQKNILKVMNSSQYKKADDYGKAQLLCDVRSRLSGDAQSQFKHWLRTTKAPRTYRKSPEVQAQDKAIAAAQAIVDKILGKARTYKDFNKKYGY